MKNSVLTGSLISRRHINSWEKVNWDRSLLTVTVHATSSAALTGPVRNRFGAEPCMATAECLDWGGEARKLSVYGQRLACKHLGRIKFHARKRE